VQAAEIALNGIREGSARRSAHDLRCAHAQQTLVNARVSLVTAQHDRVVASYSLLSAVGRLTPSVLACARRSIGPQVH